MTVEEAIGRLKTFEERVRASGGDDNEHVLLTWKEWNAKEKESGEGSSSGTSKGRGKGNWRGRGREREHGCGNGCPEEGHDDDQDYKKKIKCYNCNYMGHYASECRFKKKDERVHLAEEDDDEPTLLVAQTCALVQATKEPTVQVMLNEERVVPDLGGATRYVSDSWYLDTGASNHMTGSKEKFMELDKSVGGIVRFGDGSAVEIQGRGTVLFKCKNGEHRILTDVYYIPRLRSNIVSLGQLEENGCRMVLEDNHLCIFDRSKKLLAKARRSRNRLYILNLNIVEPVRLLTSIKEDAWLWHARYGHLNFQALQNLANKAMVVGLPHLDHIDQVCDGCLVGKQRRAPFPLEASYRANRPLELIHGDLCGPISPPTAGGNRYFLLLVDDFSRYMWISLLKTKDEALEALEKIKTAAEIEVDLKLKSLRTDRGESSRQKRLKLYVTSMESSTSSSHHTRPSKMVWLSEEIRQWWQWRGAC